MGVDAKYMCAIRGFWEGDGYDRHDYSALHAICDKLSEADDVKGSDTRMNTLSYMVKQATSGQKQWCHNVRMFSHDARAYAMYGDMEQWARQFTQEAINAKLSGWLFIAALSEHGSEEIWKINIEHMAGGVEWRCRPIEGELKLHHLLDDRDSEDDYAGLSISKEHENGWHFISREGRA